MSRRYLIPTFDSNIIPAIGNIHIIVTTQHKQFEHPRSKNERGTLYRFQVNLTLTFDSNVI